MIRWYNLDKRTEKKFIEAMQMVMIRVYGLLLSDANVRYIWKELEREIYIIDEETYGRGSR
jgi:hypothetical protein